MGLCKWWFPESQPFFPAFGQITIISINMNIETPWVLQYVSIIWDTIDTFGMIEYQIDMKMVWLNISQISFDDWNDARGTPHDLGNLLKRYQKKRCWIMLTYEMQNIARYSFVILCHYPKIIEPRNSWDSMWWPFLCLRSVGTSENTKLWRRAGWHPTSTWETHELDATNKTPKFDVIWGGWHNMTTNWFMTVRWTFWPLGIYIYILIYISGHISIHIRHSRHSHRMAPVMAVCEKLDWWICWSLQPSTSGAEDGAGTIPQLFQLQKSAECWGVNWRMGRLT